MAHEPHVGGKHEDRSMISRIAALAAAILIPFTFALMPVGARAEEPTRQVLEKLSSMLKDARPLTPSDGRPDRAEAPTSASKPSLASASNPSDGPQPDNAPAAPQTALSAGRDDGAAAPH